MATVYTPLPNGFQGLGPLGGEISPGNYISYSIGWAAANFERALSVTVGVMTVVGGIWFIFQFMSGAIQWTTAGNDKQGVQNAKKRMTDAGIGLFLVVVSYGTVYLTSFVLGLNILNPAVIIINYLKP